jgi:hypothetical protein
MNEMACRYLYTNCIDFTEEYDGNGILSPARVERDAFALDRSLLPSFPV